MAVIAAYGSITFEVTPKLMKILKNFKQTAGYRSDTNENKGTKPSTVRKGPDLQKLTFDVLLDAALGADVSVEKQKWIDAAESGTPNYFTVSGGRISKYPFICKSVEVDYQEQNSIGKPTKIMLSVSLEEYVREGKEESSSKSAVTSSSVSGGVDPAVAALLGTDTEKKRDNTQKGFAISGGWWNRG